MKKRILATLVGAFIVVNTFAGDMVSFAEENNEIVEVAKEAETAEVAEEATEDDAAVDAEETETTEEETEVEAGTETTEESSEEEETEENAVIEVKTVAFEQSKVVGDTRINMSAAAGVFPEGAYFEAVEITGNKAISSIEDAVESELSAKEEVVKVKAFDITVYNKDGVEIQPNTDAGNVSVTFSNVDTKSADEVKVFHVEDSFDSAEQVASQASGEQVSFEAEHFSVYAMVISVEDNKPEEIDEYALIKEVEVKNGDKVLASGDSVEINNGLSITYKFKSGIVVAKSADGYDDGYRIIKPGHTYKLPTLDVSKLSNIAIDGAIDGKTSIDKDGVHVGDLYIDRDGNVTLKVSETGIGDETEITIGDFIISFQLNKNEIGTLTEYDLKFGNQSFKLTIADNKAESPSMTTNGDGTAVKGKVTWTNTITNAEVPIDYSQSGYTFVGKLDANQTLDKSTFAIDVKGKSLTIDESRLTVSPNDDGTTSIIYVLNKDEVATGKKDVTKVTYTTDVDFLGNGGAQKATNNKTVTNEVKIAESADAAESIATANGSATAFAAKEIASLNKAINSTDGKFEKETIDGKDYGVGEWEITVNTNGYALNKLIIYDYMLLGENSRDYEFSLDKESLSVSKSGYELVTEPGKTSSGKAYSWYVKFNSVGAGETITLTYKTRLSNYTKYLRTNHTTAPYNTAFMTYEYEKGSGNWVEVQGPSMDVKSKITTNAGISVSTTTDAKSTYAPATKQITWTVTVNKEKQGLKDVTIYDVIPDDQVYVSSDIKGVVGDAKINKTDDNNVSFYIGNAADGKTITFNVVTELTDAEKTLWSKNKEFTKSNSFTLKATELDADGLTVTPSCSCNSEVIKLTAGKYNYVTHEIEYTVDVNDNKMLMSGISVADDLKSLGLELVSNSVSLNGNSINDTDTTGPRYTYNNGVLTVYADDVESEQVGTAAAKSTIKFKAKVTDEKLLNTTKNTDTISIANTATLYTDAFDNSVTESSEAKTTFTNNIILKDAVVDTDNNLATYVVTFNANKLVLPSNLLITDTLGASMDLDVSSVKLYIGSVDETTGEVKNSNTEEIGYTVSTSTNDADQTVLSLKLADKENNNNAYYLTYTASASDFSKTDYGNSVAIKGYTNSVITAVNVEAKALASISANLNKLAKIVITNVDQEDNNKKLANSKFVIKDRNKDVVKTLVTKADGTTKIIGGKIINGETYTIEQQTVEKGYVLKSTPVSVTVNDNTGAVTVENPRKTTSVNVSTHVDYADGQLIDGPTIKVTKDGKDFTSWTSSTGKLENLTWGHTYVITNTKAPNEYKTDDSTIVLKVELDDNGNVVVTDGKGNKVTEAKVVVKTKNSTKLVLDNVSSSQNKPITGSTIVISTTETPTAESTVTTITTDGTTKEVNLPEGTYYIVETEAPVGFEKATATKITVNSDGTIRNDTTGEVLTDGGLTIANNHNTEKYTVTYSPEVLGIDPTLFKEMKFSLFTLDSLTGKLKEVTPKSYNEETGEAIYELDYQDEYVFEPEKKVAGYDPVQPITIKAVATKNSDGNIEKKLMSKTLNAPTFSETTVENIGKAVQPKLTPPAVNNGGSSSTTNNYYYGPAKSATDDLKDKDITALADANVNANANAAAGAHLAKTGGFIGTLTGYFAAVMMILVGLYLVFGKRKRA